VVSAPAVRFLILAVPRSGSNMLCTQLGSHPSILCHHELFNPKGIRVALELRDRGVELGTMAERDAEPLAFLERMWRRFPGSPCVGFKFTHRQNEEVYPHLLADRGLRKILLRRRNRLKTYVSSLIAERLGEWEVYRRADLTAERPRVTVDLDRFYERTAFDRAYYAEIESTLEASGQTWADATYETLEERQEQNRLLRFLEQQPTGRPLRARSIKQSSRDLRDLVANFAALSRELAGTEFEEELYALDD
jgi:LPS sulfotransferase NodH